MSDTRAYKRILHDPDSLAWLDDAACKGEPTYVFFAIAAGGDKAAAALEQAARATCARCPVTEVCRDYAIKVEAEGIWGGTTYAERRQMRRNEKASA